ncbi:DUF3592 domain-containing protein [Pseudonocardia sp. C8]|uniref:DUF3592 domain-containing protein n=1 Tax=Pseudonocardia sp. C8 TaxID=2762759 RepID=UPI0016434029|nr:DUF3592 domain-containing protein [Pseudonocardia sp. C8]MBC3194488.1 DUF3592 domain-containing protein [Pseudonocardia sp. C8]
MNLYGSAQVAIGVLLCIVAVVGAGRMLRELRDMPDWPAVTGEVTGLSRDEDPARPGRARRELTVHYRYRDGNDDERDGRAPLRTDRSVEAGQAVRVQVNPRDPAQSRPVAAPRGVVIGFTVFCGALGVAGLAALLSGLARVFPT